MTGPIFIVPCGDAKLSYAAPARDLYTGSQFRYVFPLAEAAAQATGGAVLILSALHGLVEPDRVLEPYNVKMGDPGSITTAQLAKQVRRMQLVDERRPTPVYAFLSRPYYERLEAAFAAEGGHVEDVYDVPTKTARGGRIQMGEQKTRAREFLEALVEGALVGGAEPVEPPASPHAAEEWESLRVRDFPTREGKRQAASFQQVPFDASKVTFFASGTNLAGEIRGLSLVPGANIGVVAGLVDERKYPVVDAELENFCGTGRKLFVDSGAFSEVEFPPDGPPQIVKPLTDSDWQSIFFVYRRLASSFYQNVYVVAPDCVGHEEESLYRLRRYAKDVVDVYELGATVLVPLQRGRRNLAQFYREAERILGIPFTPSVPMKKNATTPEEVLAFVEEVRPESIHLLGLGVDTGVAQELIAAIQAIVPDCAISCDACLITRWVGKGPTRRLSAIDAVLRKKLGLDPEAYGEHEVHVRKALSLFLAAYNFWTDLGLARRPSYAGLRLPEGVNLARDLEPDLYGLAFALWGIEADEEAPRAVQRKVEQEVTEAVVEVAEAPRPPKVKTAPLDFDVKTFCRRYFDELSPNDRDFDPDVCAEAACAEAERRGMPIEPRLAHKTAEKAFDRALRAL
jgi:hypothetical protein